MEKNDQAGCVFQSLTEAINTNSPSGRMKMQIVGAFAEFERAMLPERASNRLNAVRKEEHIDERRPKLHAHQEK